VAPPAHSRNVMTDWLSKLETRATGVAHFSALCAITALIALTLLTIADVFMRWLFNSPIDGVADLSPLIVAVAVSAAFPLAVIRRYHISIGFLGHLLTPRWRSAFDVLSSAVTAVFFILLAWQFIRYGMTLHDNGQTTWLLRLPVAPWWAAVALFLTLCAALQTLVFVSHLHSAIQEREQELALSRNEGTDKKDARA